MTLKKLLSFSVPQFMHSYKMAVRGKGVMSVESTLRNTENCMKVLMVIISPLLHPFPHQRKNSTLLISDLMSTNKQLPPSLGSFIPQYNYNAL